MGVVESVPIDYSKVLCKEKCRIDKEQYIQIQKAYSALLEKYRQLINDIIHKNDDNSKILFWDRLNKAADALFNIFEKMRTERIYE